MGTMGDTDHIHSLVSKLSSHNLLGHAFYFQCHNRVLGKIYKRFKRTKHVSQGLVALKICEVLKQLDDSHPLLASS